MSVTLASWNAAWRELGVQQPDEALFNRLVACYSEKHRHYHTLQHLRECLDTLAPERGRARHPAEVELALWFHDAFYDVHRDDNEARSADWARDAMLAAGVAPDAAQRVHAMVIATDGHAPSDDPDTQLLIDVDLAILGAPPERFDESSRQIRAEYIHRPDPVFREGRIRVLGGFLARPRLYVTEPFHDACEAQARANLQRAIEQLRAGG